MNDLEPYPIWDGHIMMIKSFEWLVKRNFYSIKSESIV